MSNEVVRKSPFGSFRIDTPQEDEVIVTKQQSNPQTDVFNAVQKVPWNSWNLSKSTIRKFMYPVTERCAEMFPELAMFLSRKGIDPYNVACAWNSLFREKYGLRYQDWMRYKKLDKATKKKDTSDDILKNDSLILEYAILNGVDKESVRMAIQFYPDEMREELKIVQDMIKSKTEDIDVDVVDNGDAKEYEYDYD